MATSYRLVHDRIQHDLIFFRMEPEGPEDAERPLVILLHGLRSDKESVLEPCYHFARRGFRAVAPDLRFHGERDHADTREERLQDSYVPTMLAIIQKTVADVSAIVDHFGASKAALHGVSMGGIVTFASLLVEPRIAAASVAMGSPDWAGMLATKGITRDHPQFPLIESYSPLAHAASMAPRALLMLHGELDETVPIEGVRRLKAKLDPLYRDQPDRLELVEYPDLGHYYTDDMMHRSVSWVERYL